MSNRICSVDEGSPLSGRVSPGETLISLSGHEIVDVLDYKFYGYDSTVTVVVADAQGRERRIRVKKREGEDLGLCFETYLMDKPRACANHCVFCFVDQLPRGLRPTLYFKDDDARLSFLQGSYITLTNLSEREIERIMALRISPINVSVHATEPALRAKLLGNKDGAAGFSLMQRLAEAGIVMNCQIVCCPGLNDGAALAQSMEELFSLYPQVPSVSIVPVGLTAHREKLTPLTPFTRETARATIAQVETYAQACLEHCGSQVFFCADELYLKAELPLPEDETYEDYPQLENGVGLLRLFITEFEAALHLEEGSEEARHISIATGVSAAGIFEKLLLTAKEKYANIEVSVYAIENDFFGHSINVAGLITGRDLIAQLRGKELGERLFLARNMFRHGEGVFLDDTTVEDVEKAFAVPVTIVEQDGGDFFDKIFLGQY